MQSRIFGLGFLLVASILAGCSSSNDGKNGANGNAQTGGNVPAAKFFLPTGEPTNTADPTIETDKDGGIHAVYPNYAGGGAFYAYCPADCAGEGAMKIVHFETDGTVGNAMLALDGEGRPQVLLSSYQKVYYAHPTGDFTDPASWSNDVVLEHGGEREVTGEAFALDPAGRPRFLMHVYKAYLGVGQKAPATYYVQCDANCAKPASWKQSKIQDEMWRGSSLRIDDSGVAHVATVTTLGRTESSSGTETVAYARCDAGCTTEDDWKGIAFLPAYESSLEAVNVRPAVSLALTKAGAPRVAFLGLRDEKKSIGYFECDANCDQDNWRGSIISDHEKLGPGLDLALDANDHPRLAYTLDYNIALAFCDDADCTVETAGWDLSKVEYGGEMKPDEIFLYDNCNVGAWFLHDPSLALDAQGRPRVGYQARDISGGWSNPDPTKPRCVAGTDMTWSRLAIMSAVK